MQCACFVPNDFSHSGELLDLEFEVLSDGETGISGAWRLQLWLA